MLAGRIDGMGRGELIDEVAALKKRGDDLARSLRAVVGECDDMLAGGSDGPAERCVECKLGPYGYLRDALTDARVVLAKEPE